MKPLVSILIPTCNRPQVLRQSLRSALEQTYPNTEIIICDNSDNDLTERVVQSSLAESRFPIKYIRHPENIGPIPNFNKCLVLSSGEYINFLMDDDLLHPRKIEMMIPYLLQDENVTLVSSRRQVIDNSGRKQSVRPEHNCFPSPDGIMARVNGKQGIQAMLAKKSNLIGPPTAVLFRKHDLIAPFGTYHGKPAHNSVDVAAWFTLLEKKDFVFLTKPLSSFRKHRKQVSRTTLSRMARICDWIDFTAAARQHGLLQNPADLQQVLLRFEAPVTQQFPVWNEKTNGKYEEELEERIQTLIRLSKHHPSLDTLLKKWRKARRSL